MGAQRPPKVVLFDIGGVVVCSAPSQAETTLIWADRDVRYARLSKASSISNGRTAFRQTGSISPSDPVHPTGIGSV